MRPAIPRSRRARSRSRDGLAAIEFAAFVPILAVMLVGVVDVGKLVALRLQVEGDVAAAVNLAVVNAAQATSGNGTTLASTIASAMGGIIGSTLNSGQVIVNNGPAVTITNGAKATSGTAANADSCYCPTGTTAPWTWGKPVACGAACPSGGYAGKFVSVSETQTYTPIFSAYSLLLSTTIASSAIVQVQ